MMKMRNLYVGKKSLIVGVSALMTLLMAKDDKLFAQSIKHAKNQVASMNVNAANLLMDVDNVDFSYLIDARANKAVSDYVDTVKNRVADLSGKKGKAGYMRALKQRFGAPAPVYRGKHAHCVWGERKSFDAAAAALNLDISPIPETDACSNLINTIRQQNPESSFYGVIWESRKAYSAAREKFANRQIAAWRNSSKRTISKNEIEQKRKSYLAAFDKKNIAADDIKSGSLYSTYGHTEMFLGRGRVVNKKFVADAHGEFCTIGFNNEMVRKIAFANGKSGNVFIGHTNEILVEKLQNQVDQIKQMPRNKLLERARNENIADDDYLKNLSDNELKILLLEKLLGVQLTPTYRVSPAMMRQQNVRNG